MQYLNYKESGFLFKKVNLNALASYNELLRMLVAKCTGKHFHVKVDT
jgi:hypothetical protein